MRTFSIMFLVLTSTLRLNAESHLSLGQIRYSGTGCPKNSVSYLPTSDAFTLLFDSFSAETGEGVSVRKRMKTCNIIVPISVDRGYRANVESVDYRGFIHLESKVFGFLYSYFVIPGELFGTSSLSTFSGPLEKDFFRRDLSVAVNRKACSKKPQTVNLSLFCQMAVIPFRSKANGTIQLDSADGVVEARLISRRCD